MKQRMNPVLSDKIVDELRLKCCVCDKAITGFYASFDKGGSCSKRCMLAFEEKRKEERRIANDKFCERFGL